MPSSPHSFQYPKVTPVAPVKGAGNTRAPKASAPHPKPEPHNGSAQRG